jgi:hypothetical protein
MAARRGACSTGSARRTPPITREGSIVSCTHHWRIESPNGPTSHGVCRHCGAERAFPTSSYADVWHGDPGKARREQAAGSTTPTAPEVIRVLWR